MFIPEDVKFILNKIKQNGYTALIVGGCIRDSFLNKTPKDYDIATNCDYEVLKEIFKSYNPKEIGKQFGILQVNINNISYEIAKFRTDVSYSNNRSPDSVKFVDNFKDDANRRDFTINAIGYDGENIFDYFGGIEDIKNKVIRFIGNPEERINEDALRMLRAIRFACINNFELLEETKSAIKNNANLIKNISNERIRDEFNKILIYDGIDLLRITGLLEIILPELNECVNFDQHNPHHNKNVYEHIVSVVNHTKPILNHKLSALFHDIGKPKTFSIDDNNIGHFYGHEKESAEIAENVMRRLKYDNKTIDIVCNIVKNHMNKEQCTSNKSVKKLINKIGEENLECLFDLLNADILGGAEPYNFKYLNDLIENINKVLNNKEPTKINQLAVNGYDVMEFGIKGKNVGTVLDKLMQLVLENPDINTKEVLINKIKEEIK